ncbi:KN motif and ankyrin repeat domain-containing protein 2 isoform X2 [Chironomus tepperi]|uniref:KN motif and ankyrin repeat domain-containing protein 2 isoform X2 n=1 Tax=Chironomus tepperi TaxID=113505 RepID=UPI00391F1DCE
MKDQKQPREVKRRFSFNQLKRAMLFDNCIPNNHHAKPSRTSLSPKKDTLHHISIESIDGSLLMQQNGTETLSSSTEVFYKKRIFDLEEQTKLIPLLQMQIESLKDEQKQLVLQLEASRAPSSSSSSSPAQQTHFQIHRVSPVSLNSMKLNTNVLTKRNVGTNTAMVLSRDVGIMSDKKTFSNAATITDFRLACDGDGGRLYSEKDLKKTVELVHSKMRKAMVSVGVQHVDNKTLRDAGVQHVENKPSRDVGVGTKIHVTNASSSTDEPHLVMTPTKVINIDAQSAIADPIPSTLPSVSLKDLAKPPVTRHNTTQTTQGAVQHQMVQVTPYGCNKGTDSIDLVRTVNRATGTEMIYKRDQTVNTSDLIKTQNTATNTTVEPQVTKRTTSSNTEAVPTKTIGINYEPVIEPSSSKESMKEYTSKIPRPSPSVQRKFTRQDTFTVNTIAPVSLTSITTTTTVIKSPSPILKSPSYYAKSPHLPISSNPSSLFDFRRTPDRIIVTDVEECPVEKVLKLTMNHQRSPSPVQKSPAQSSPVSHSDIMVAEPLKSPLVEQYQHHSQQQQQQQSQQSEPEQEDDEDDDEDEEDEEPKDDKPTSMPLPSKMPMSPSVEYLDDDEDDDDEYEDDEFNDEQLPSSMPMRPPPTSISTIRLVQEGRMRIKPSKEMISALKVINDHLQINPEPIESQIHSASQIAACEWFQISSTEKANPDNVEDYLDYFEEQSWDLLSYMVNLTDKNGNMAMHYAVSHGNFDVVSILLDSKVCNINQTNNAGYTCCMLVSLAKLFISEHRTVVQRLFKLSDVNLRATKNSQTALMLAVSHGNFEIVQMMVEAGADINIQDDDGSTALMCAAEQGHLDIIKFLLAQNDCDSTKQDVDGNTALKISLEAGYHDIGCLLYAHEHLIRSKSTVKRTPSRKSSTSSLT